MCVPFVLVISAAVTVLCTIVNKIVNVANKITLKNAIADDKFTNVFN